MLLSDTASVTVVVPIVYLAYETLASFLLPAQGHEDFLLAVHTLVKRLEVGHEAQLQPLTEEKAYMLASMCDHA